LNFDIGSVTQYYPIWEMMCKQIVIYIFGQLIPVGENHFYFYNNQVNVKEF